MNQSHLASHSAQTTSSPANSHFINKDLLSHQLTALPLQLRPAVPSLVHRHRSRKRGVILTEQGWQKLQHAHVLQDRFGERYTFAMLSDCAVLSPRTVAKIVSRETGVDLSTLKHFFAAFDLQLDSSDYSVDSPNSHLAEAVSSDTEIHQLTAVQISSFYGRAEELTQLQQWIVQDQCRLISILGMVGIGKTILAAKLVQQVRGKFDVVIWKSLHDAPPLRVLLSQLIAFLSEQAGITSPVTEESSVSDLLKYFCNQRCLLVLDNWESIFQRSERVGCHRHGYEDYGELLKRIAETNHQSCLLLASRENPRELHRLESGNVATHCLRLSGLPTAVGQAFLQNIGEFSGTNTDWHELVEYYGGNPLLLRIIARFIQEYVGGDLAEFDFNQGQYLVDEIQDVLQEQFERLSCLEQQVISWFASDRHLQSLATLRAEMMPFVSLGELLASVDSLRQRALLNQHTTEGREETLFYLSPVVRDYALNWS